MRWAWSSRLSVLHRSVGWLCCLLPLSLNYSEAPWLRLRGPEVLPFLRVVTVTYYSSTRRETDKTPRVTASGTRVRRGILAVSRDLLAEAPYGSVVELDGQLYVVEDTMHRRWRKRVDVWVPSREEALRGGRRVGLLLLQNLAISMILGFCDYLLRGYGKEFAGAPALR